MAVTGACAMQATRGWLIRMRQLHGPCSCAVSCCSGMVHAYMLHGPCSCAAVAWFMLLCCMVHAHVLPVAAVAWSMLMRCQQLQWHGPCSCVAWSVLMCCQQLQWHGPCSCVAWSVLMRCTPEQGSNAEACQRAHLRPPADSIGCRVAHMRVLVHWYVFLPLHAASGSTHACRCSAWRGCLH
eukprot:355900-Chlamydomonas_euryale.AAC.2